MVTMSEDLGIRFASHTAESDQLPDLTDVIVAFWACEINISLLPAINEKETIRRIAERIETLINNLND